MCTPLPTRPPRLLFSPSCRRWCDNGGLVWNAIWSNLGFRQNPLKSSCRIHDFVFISLHRSVRVPIEVYASLKERQVDSFWAVSKTRSTFNLQRATRGSPVSDLPQVLTAAIRLRPRKPLWNHHRGPQRTQRRENANEGKKYAGESRQPDGADAALAPVFALLSTTFTNPYHPMAELARKIRFYPATVQSTLHLRIRNALAQHTSSCSFSGSDVDVGKAAPCTRQGSGE